MTGRRLRLVVPAPWDAVSGGSAYDRELLAALRRVLGDGARADVVEGAWPVPTGEDLRRLEALLLPDDGDDDSDDDSDDDEGGGSAADVLVDGLVAAAAPEQVRAAVAAGVAVHVLVHLPLALEGGLSAAEAARRGDDEGRALRAATSVLATSRWAARDLRARHGLARVGVAVPGTHPAPLARGSRGGGVPQLLQLASVGPRKDQRGVVGALARLRDLPWTAVLAGPVADPACAAQVDLDVAAAGLSARVRRTGPVGGADLERLWDTTDVLLLPSAAETWGMVVTEALARGIPAVVGAGTGAEEALRGSTGSTGSTGDPADQSPPRPQEALAGALVAPGDPGSLASALRALLERDLAGDGDADSPHRAAALRRRAELCDCGGWDTTAAAVLDHLDHPSRRAAQETSRGT